MSGELVVAGSTIPGEYVLPALIGQFKAKYPEISTRLRVGSSRQASEWVEEGEVEIGVVGARPSSRALAWRELMADEMVIVVPPDHRWAGLATVTLEDVRSESLILRERGSGTREALERALHTATLDFSAFHIAGEMGSTQAVKQAVRAGVGIAFISRRAVLDECRARLLVCVKVANLEVPRAFYIVTHRDRTRSPLAQAFLEFLESQTADGASQAPS